jgi:hypothetical protein
VLKIATNSGTTFSLPNPTIYKGVMTVWLDSAYSTGFTTPSGTFYIVYSGTYSGQGASTCYLTANFTSLFTFISDGTNWSIWAYKTA